MIEAPIHAETHVVSSGDADAPQRKPQDLSKVILDIARLGLPFGTPDVRHRFPSLETSRVAHAIARAVDTGSLKKVAHGVYLRCDLPMPPQREIDAARRRRRKTYTRQEDPILDFLTEPRTSKEVQQHFALTHKCVVQRLEVLMAEGLVFRQGRSGSYRYSCAPDRANSPAKKQPVKLDSMALQILRCLPETGPVDRFSLSEHTGIPWHVVRQRIKPLLKLDLVDLVKIGRQVAVCLSPKGRKHPERSKPSPRLPMCNLRGHIGPLRSDILLVVDRMQPIKTQGIRRCLLELNPDYDLQLLTQTLARMRKDGLLRYTTTPVANVGHLSHILGDEAKPLIDWLREASDPTAEHLRDEKEHSSDDAPAMKASADRQKD
jgi:hypothetical protein